MAAEHFFSRWSQRKQQADDAGPLDGPTAQESEQPSAASQKAAHSTPALAPELTATDVGKLTLESDYAAYMGKEVDAGIRRSAMKKLFFNPQLSVMDGLDIYIDDYNKTTPIPAAMLSALEQARSFLLPVEEPIPEPAPVVQPHDSDAADPASEPERVVEAVDTAEEDRQIGPAQQASDMPESVTVTALSDQSHATPAPLTPDAGSAPPTARNPSYPNERASGGAADSFALRNGKDR